MARRRRTRKPVPVRTELSDLLDNRIYPALHAHLDRAFPEFKFERRGDAWHATEWPATVLPEAKTKTPGRIVAYNDSPWCVQVHGRGAIRWLSYVGDKETLRGADFKNAVAEIARRAGVDIPDGLGGEESANESECAIWRRDTLDFATKLCHEALLGPGGEAARTYLRLRGVEESEIRSFHLGLFTGDVFLSVLQFSAKGPCDGLRMGINKLSGRITIPWRDLNGHILTIYGRCAGPPPDESPKLIALPGHGSKSVPLYFDCALAAGETEIVLVEGLLDALVAQARGDRRVVASASAAIPHRQIQALAARGVRRVILCGDPDDGGDAGNLRNACNLKKAGIEPLVAPRLPDGLDPDEFINRRGIEAWREHIAAAEPGAVYIARSLTASTGPDSPEDERHAALEAVSRALASFDPGDLDAAAAEAAARLGIDPAAAIAEIRHRRPLSFEEAMAIRGSAVKRELLAIEVDLKARTGDAANAQVLLAIHSGRLRYVKTWDRWIVWIGGRWIVDSHSAVQAKWLAADVAEWLRLKTDQLYVILNGLDKNVPEEKKRIAQLEDLVDTLRNLARTADGSAGLSNVLKMAQPDERVLLPSHEVLDTHAWLLNTPGGIVDLRRGGDPIPHDPSLLMTRMTKVPYIPGAEAPRFRKFMAEIIPDEEVRSFLQRMLGCGLIGKQTEEAMLYLPGEGSNGKSTMVRILGGVLGDYFAAVPMDFLDADRRKEHPTELAELFGKRIAVCAESREGVKWDEARVKYLTGNDRRYCRRMREDAWSYEPTDTLIVHGNQLPVIRGVDHGIWRRIYIVRFLVRFGEGGRAARKGLSDELLEAEGPGILAWLVEGAVEYGKRGLDPPEQVLLAVKKHKLEMDIVGRFLEEECETQLGEAVTTGATPLFEAFSSWYMASEGPEPPKQAWFGARLKERGMKKRRLPGGVVYIGIRIRKGER